jgi:hypothetical protein
LSKVKYSSDVVQRLPESLHIKPPVEVRAPAPQTGPVGPGPEGLEGLFQLIAAELSSTLISLPLTIDLSLIDPDWDKPYYQRGSDKG